MNMQFQIPKIWSDFVADGNKRQRRALRALAPHLPSEGLAGGRVRDADLAAAYVALQAEYSRAPAMENGEALTAESAARRAVNSFVAAYNKILEATDAEGQRLGKIAGPRALRADDRAAFLKIFDPQIDAFQAPRALTAKKADVERTALHNCWAALEAGGVHVTSLTDFLEGRHIEIVVCARRQKPAALAQACDVLHALATFHDNPRIAKLVISIRKKRKTPPGASNQTLGRLKPWLEDRKYFDLVAKAADAARLDRPIDLTIEKNLFAVQSAIYLLLALLLPAKYETLSPAAFAGPARVTEAGARPQLVNFETSENLEQALNPAFAPTIIDSYFFALSGLGVPPTRLFADLSGRPRAGQDLISNSVEKLLERFGVDLKLHELRDLGVGQMMMNGDSARAMAVACRISPRAFSLRYEKDFRNMINALLRFKR